MIKKLLFFILFSFSAIIYAQETRSLKSLGTHPNPFNFETKISFQSDKYQPVILTVKNILGKTILAKEIKAEKGKNSIPFRRNDLNSGMYIYSIQTSKEIVSKRFVIK
ncbi:Por secretion system C-terminal sorting domain-containing protein [Tenacibaculum sp. MAR_2009_124]|uniref:T9SS type A sorting domain-containing protein n=1 Tax=Tenacibaculum sp. MAR_2009_124 TaxID=1250059 RepID=UPI0008985F64|nr:T9SS type A sorting domain-containing protein [Tenacibaculum sp. MAR_2009_124]SEB40931.1 Por secretion system C-terminal sorting domain-containing protein [Tenacibaculum sp. MAR_2009_124]